MSFDIFTQKFTVDLQATTLSLDFRVTVLEEDGGSDGNSSVAELEVRVETLEGTAADHEAPGFQLQKFISYTNLI